MGLFSSTKSVKSTNKVWMTRDTCIKGLAREGLLAMKNSEVGLVITVFEESNAALISFLDLNKVPYQLVSSFSGKDVFQQTGSLLIVDASSGSIGKNLSSDKKSAILFFGRCPNRATENKMMEDLSSQFPGCKISFCLSLEDPVFEALGVDRIKPLMESLGMKDDECIEHPMVDKAITNAMEKINKSLITERKAHSEKEWFIMNT
jgi:hypothetical protein